MASKFGQKNDLFLDRSWKGSGVPKWVPTRKNPIAQDPRGVSPLLWLRTLSARFRNSRRVVGLAFLMSFIALLCLPIFTTF